MLVGKDEKDANCDTNSRRNSCNQEEREAQERLRSRPSRIEHQLKSCIIPEWIQRWALGD